MSTDLIIVKKFIENHPDNAARILENLQIMDLISFIEEVPIDLVVQFFVYLDRYTVVQCLKTLSVEQSAKIIERLPLDIAATYLRRLDKELTDPILNLVSKGISTPLGQILRFPEDTVGAFIDPLVLTLPEDITVKDALKRLQKRSEEAIYYLYVVRRDSTLAGVINIRELLLASPKDQLASVMHTNVVKLSAEANFQVILDHPEWLSYHALPVVDRSGIFLGAIHHTTLRRIERVKQKRRLPREAIIASTALGQLYRIGLTGLIRSATEDYGRPKK